MPRSTQGMSWSDDELKRYSRQMLLRPVGIDGQERLKRSSVLVVGAGGLGSPALLYLAAAGVGRLSIVDPDCVELSNLGRQVLYGSGDIGRPKVEVAAERLQRLNPFVAVDVLDLPATPALLEKTASQHDLLLEGSDSFELKFAVNDVALRHQRWAVIGAVRGFEGQMMVVGPGDSGCYRCLFEEPPPEAERETCRAEGVLGPIVGVVGSFLAAEALTILSGLGPRYQSRLLRIDLLAGQVRAVPFDRRPDCTAGHSPLVSSGRGRCSDPGAGKEPIDGD